jgi:hypothetical protein
MNVQALATVKRFGLKSIFIVVNNGIWGISACTRRCLPGNVLLLIRHDENLDSSRSLFHGMHISLQYIGLLECGT